MTAPQNGKRVDSRDSDEPGSPQMDHTLGEPVPHASPDALDRENGAPRESYRDSPIVPVSETSTNTNRSNHYRPLESAQQVLAPNYNRTFTDGTPEGQRTVIEAAQSFFDLITLAHNGNIVLQQDSQYPYRVVGPIQIFNVSHENHRRERELAQKGEDAIGSDSCDTEHGLNAEAASSALSAASSDETEDDVEEEDLPIHLVRLAEFRVRSNKRVLAQTFGILRAASTYRRAAATQS